MKTLSAILLVLVSTVALADLPAGKGEKPPAGSIELVVDRHGAAHAPDVRKFLRDLARRKPNQGDMVSEASLLLRADADAPFEAVADVLSLCAGLRADNAPGISPGMIYRIRTAVRGKEGVACVKVFLPRRPLGEAALPAKSRKVVLVCGGEKPYRLSPLEGLVEILGLGFQLTSDDRKTVPVSGPKGEALDLKALIKAAGKARDGAVLFHCGTDGRWGDLLAAHRALNPAGVLQLIGRGYPHMQRYDQWQARNRGRLVPSGPPGLPPYAPGAWALEATLLKDGAYLGTAKVDTKGLPAALEKEANAAPRDDTGCTRRGLSVIASREVPWERVLGFLRTAFGAPARFGSASIVLSSPDGLVAIRAVPPGGVGQAMPEVEEGARFEEVALRMPKVLELP